MRGFFVIIENTLVMARFIKRDCSRTLHVIFSRTLHVLTLALFLLLINPTNVFGQEYGGEGTGGWTPTRHGLIINFEPGDQFLLSTVINGQEYFVCDYEGYKGGDFSYPAGSYLKLLSPQGDKLPSGAIWTVDTANTVIWNKVDHALGGIIYTMWSIHHKTLITNSTRDALFSIKYYADDAQSGGWLADADGGFTQNRGLCDVAFVVPTDNSTTITADPNNTLRRASATGKFNGKMDVGFNDMIYREVYWFMKARYTGPYSYTNTTLVSFDSTNVAQGKGRAFQINAKKNGVNLRRRLFRIYPLNKPFASCSSYFFGWDVQDYKKYRKTNNIPGASGDSTSARKIYTLDHFHCMSEGETGIYQTDIMQIPTYDSAYYYVGYNNTYYPEVAGTPLAGVAGVYSQFRNIKMLGVKDLNSFRSGIMDTLYTAKGGAYGRMVANTASDKENMGVVFEPAGYFLKISTGKNVRLIKTGDHEWTSEELWEITEAWSHLKIKTTLYTGPDFSETDKGADIRGWSTEIYGTDVDLSTGGKVHAGSKGLARITTNSSDPNGHIVLVAAREDRHVHYDNNGLLGAQIPDQYPASGETTVPAQDARLKFGFNFEGWATAPDGAVVYHAGDVITLSDPGTLTLYAKGSYTGRYNVALSFEQGGQRYFMTQPVGETERYVRPRSYTDWTNVYLGMGDQNNTELNYLSTYSAIGKPTCVECELNEYVLYPHKDTLRGYEDSLVTYDLFEPADSVSLGLYYDDPSTDLHEPNTIVANNTWAGLFVSSGGWPDYNNQYVNNTKLSSQYGLRNNNGHNERFQLLNEGTTPIPPYIQYQTATNRFDGVATADAGTNFQISNVVPADAHYVVLPDTATEEWNDEIVFDYHNNKTSTKQVWSKVIGKQLLAAMFVSGDTIYFHPNRKKIFTTAAQLRQSQDFRLTQSFALIRDTRAQLAIEANKATIATTDNDFLCNVTSGLSSPIDLYHKDHPTEPIDVCDTLRITLTQSGISRIKKYYGRWSDNAPGLKKNADGSRYRDIIIRTKTYHYGAVQNKLVLTPEFASYNFGPLANQTQTINFTLSKVKTRQLMDVTGNVVGEATVETKDTTAVLHFDPSMCSFTGSYFDITNVVNGSVTLSTKADNTLETNRDTLTVTFTMDGQTVTASVPLMQAALTDNELIWSAVYNNQRYFILAGSDQLIFRQYAKNGANLVKLSDKKTALIKGSANATNSDATYITPWEYIIKENNQIALKTKYNINRHFNIASSTPGVAPGDSVLLTYEYDHIHLNDNANYEELVRLKYGTDYLVFNGPSSPFTWTTDPDAASVFYFGYLQQEYNLLNNGTYPSDESLTFGYNRTDPAAVTTKYQAYREYSMLVNNSLLYLCREKETNLANLTGSGWKTTYTVALVPDRRTFDTGSPSASGFTKSPAESTFTSTITPTGDSPKNVKINDKYVNIVDTLQVTLGLQSGAPTYRFKGGWTGYKSINDAQVKIPLIRKTYHTAAYDSLVCTVDGDEYNYTFPATIVADNNDTHTFTLQTWHREGINTLDVDNNSVAFDLTEEHSHTSYMHLDQPAYAEIRLADAYGKKPDWCEISAKGANTITVKCTKQGIRSPREAYIYIAYMINTMGVMRIVHFRLSVSQLSFYQEGGAQTLIHSPGASGDTLMADGRQQVHENKRILYYYNPSNTAQSTDQRVELPIRERGFYGWWRWYEEGNDRDLDVPNEKWQTRPTNTGKSWNNPYRIIGTGANTMGRYTVFHYPSIDYGNKNDPPAKSPFVYPPVDKAVVTYVADIGNYTDNLPLSVTDENQIDQDKLAAMENIIEPTLSVRESFELHPWTEMANIMENYKSHDGATFPIENEHYMEDHVVMAPLGNQLLLRTEQRYNYANLQKYKHSESLLGYYMKDDNWNDPSWDATRKDTMIWCGGWQGEVPCNWYTYNPKNKTYTICSQSLTERDDFFKVPTRNAMTAGHEFDTLYYCLRARSVKTTTAGTPQDPDPATPVAGDYWFNICRYKIIYHQKGKYGPKEEINGEALITNANITQNYETLERLNFDYNKPGEDYTIYPHPLPWADGSYGYTYPISYETPHNRYHSQADFPGPGEYALINYIPYHAAPPKDYWRYMEQHGGKENGYMIYCDGMSSPGQVAALTLSTQLCTGQKMYFSGYVGNVSSQSGKANPNFTFSVQGAEDLVGGGVGPWEDITSYMTGDIVPSNNWYQIFFPISQEKDYDHYRIRIYNMADTYDGNDFVLDDMCVFATKPPLVAYQANTTCKENGENDSTTHVVLRIDYQGFTDENLNNVDVHYTIEKTKNEVTSSIKLEDGYFNEYIEGGKTCGKIHMPAHKYAPEDQDSVFTNVTDLIHSFERTLEPGHGTLFRQGYVYENLDDSVRPVMYVIHGAKIVSEKGTRYTVRMAGSHAELSSSVCAMTSNLKVTNRIVLQLNGEEYSDMAPSGLCANTAYDISLSVKGSLFMDSIAPIELNGSCVNDWLLYGDTSDVTSPALYGYKYSDIVTVITKILRVEPAYGTNTNQKAATFAAISRAEMDRLKVDPNVPPISEGVDPYTLVKDLVEGGFLILYRSNMINTVAKGDSMQYVIFPIVGTGSDAMNEANVEVCPTPVVIKIKPTLGENTPLIISGGGITRTGSEATKPLVFLMDEQSANDEIKVHIDDLIENRVLDDVSLIFTNDTNFREGVHTLSLTPDKEWQVGVTSTENYYRTGDTIYLHPSGNAYHMRPGFDYTFSINLQTWTGGKSDTDGCSAGSATFIISVVPNYARWEPKNPEDNQWNNPENWLGVNEYNQPIRPDAHYVPLATTGVIIPTLDAGLPYPSLPDPSEFPAIKEVGTTYNSCDYIRFMPNTAISGQERLNYEKAIIDMNMPYRKWAFRAAPVTGMLSGDVYMSEADLLNQSNPWEVGEFDAAGRSYQTGNATFWMSLYNTDIVSKGNGDQVKDTARVANAGWSKMVNGMTLSLPPATGWTVFARTASGKAANVRLPKNDDIFYYYYANGDKALDQYEHNLRDLRKTYAGGEAGKLAFHPDGTSQTYTINNGKGENDAAIATNAFAFGNPTMGYIDIWGFISDNDLKPEFQYLDADGKTWQKVTAETRDLATNTIDKKERYLPPMHAIMVYKKSDATATSLEVTVNASRVVTAPVVPAVSPAPKRATQGLQKGIMTVTAVNPKFSRYTSRLLLGQGYNKAVLEGEDAMVTAVNIDNFTKNTTPAMPFNIYAVEEGYGLCIDLTDTILNVPISFYMSTMTAANQYDSVTYLWFTGVNNVGGTLVLYDALTDISRPILDGICLPIETPEQSHQVRYFIRRVGPVPTIPDDPIDPISTEIENVTTNNTPLEAYKIFYNGHVYIIRNGHVYTMFGQRVR